MKTHYSKSKRIFVVALSFVVMVAALVVLTSCGGGGGGGSGKRETKTSYLVPKASGSKVKASGPVSVDYSNISDGYIMVKYTGSAKKIKIQLVGPDGNTYTYTSHKGGYETFPLSAGSGSYKVSVLENVQATFYSMALSMSVSAKIEDEFSPYLYPNQYVWYTEDMRSVALAQKLSQKSSNDLDYVSKVYDYVTKKIDYDNELAADPPVDYVPVIDNTLESGKGICFDYASLMSAMLRAQGVPTKLVIGYSGPAYHAWISVYLKEVGWVDNIIEFDGKSWSLMDPTLASSASDKTVKQYIGDGSNYTEKYHY